MRRTKEEAENTRQKILKAAVTVMNKKGLASTRFEDIAEEADVTRGAIYHYFKNKNEIIYAVHLAFHNSTRVFFDKVLSNNIDPMLGVKEGLIKIFNRFENDEYFRNVEELFSKVEFASLIKEDEELALMFEKEKNEMKKKLQDILIDGQKSGCIRTDISIDNLRITIMSFYIGFVHLWFSQFTNFSIGDVAEDYVNILIDGIKSK